MPYNSVTHSMFQLHILHNLGDRTSV